MSLYETSMAYREFLEALESGEIPEEAAADTLEAIQGEFSDKADNLACLVKNLEAEAAAIKGEEESLSFRRKAKENRAKWLREYLSQALLEAGQQKLETARNKLSFRKSAAVCIPDEEAFKREHRELCRVEEKVSIQRPEVARLLKEGRAIQGASLEMRQNLQIK